jgi:hypothetical protein
MSTTDSIYNWVESHNSPHLTKTLIHKFVTKTLCRNHLRNLLLCTSDMPSTTDLLSLRFHRLHRFRFRLTHASNRPAFPDFPKISPKVGRSTLSTESTSRQHKSTHVELLGFLRELAPLRLSLPQNHIAFLALLPWLWALVPL